MKRAAIVLAVCCAFASMLPEGNAGVIFNNGGPDNMGHFESDFAATPSVRAADDFTLAEAAVIRDVHWWGVYNDHIGVVPDTDSFTIEVYPTSGGVLVDPTPAHAIVVGDVGRTNTNAELPGDGLYVYRYDVGGLNIPLAAGTYALCIVNDTTGVDRTWHWARASGGGTMWTRTGPLTWEQVSYSARTAFRLTDNVPEPAGLGLIGLAMLTLKRRRNS